MASIHAVSQAAGVSVATVSRVINRSTLVSPKTKAIVHAAIRQLGYIPPPIEKRQRRFTGRPVGTRKGNIALLFPDVRDDALRTALSRRLTQGVGELLAAKSLNLIVTSLAPDADLPLCIRDRQVDGVIIRGSKQALSFAHELNGTPAVWLLEVGDSPAAGDQVIEDNDAIGRLAATCLFDRGHRVAACINPQGAHPAYSARCNSFARSFTRLGGRVELLTEENEEVPIWNTRVWQPQLSRLVDELVARAREHSEMGPSAAFLPLPDDMVLFVRDCLARHQVSIGFGGTVGKRLDLIVCTYDPLRMSALPEAMPQIDIHAEAIGRAAAELLLWRLRNPREPQRRVLIAPSLLEDLANG